MEGWFRVHVLCELSGKSIKAFAKDATKNTTWTASTIENRIGMIRWALANINKEGKKEVMFLNGDKFVSVVDSMEQIVVSRYPKQHSTVKAHEKKDRVVAVKTMDYKEVRKRLNGVVLNGKALTSEQKDIIAFAIMQEQIK